MICKCLLQEYIRSEGATKGLRVFKSLSYRWLRHLIDLEFKCGNLETDQYKVTVLPEFDGIFSFSFVVSLVHEMNTSKTQNY